MQHIQQALNTAGAALKKPILWTKQGDVAVEKHAILKFSIEFYGKC